MAPPARVGLMSDENVQRSPLMMAALGMNELFETLVTAGFTEQQALRLIGHMMTDMLTEEAD